LAVVEVIGLTKVFGGVKAVDSVSFTVGREVFGLMGPNGSGKSTLLSMIAGVLRPTSGVVRVGGFNVWGSGSEMAKARRLIGYAPQKPPLRFDVSAYDNLVWHCLVRGLGLIEARRRARELLEAVGLEEHARKTVWELSGGMVKRLVVATALVGEPEVIMLDEPSSGVDPAYIDELWATIMRVSKGRTLIYTTHNPLEAERYSSRTGVMHRGRLIAVGEPRELVEAYAPHPLVYVKLRGPPEPLDVEGCRLLETLGDTLVYEAVGVGCVERIIAAYRDSGLDVEKLEVRKPGLEAVFKRLVGGE